MSRAPGLVAAAGNVDATDRSQPGHTRCTPGADRVASAAAMHRILFATVLLSLTLPLSAQNKEETPPGYEAKKAAALKASGHDWFPERELNQQMKPGQEDAVGVFRFKNPGDKPVEWKQMLGSCTCTSAKVRVADRNYELQPKPLQLFRVTGSGDAVHKEPVASIPIAAGESGEVEVHMAMHGAVGAKSVSLDIHTSDPEVPVIKLQLTAAGLTAITVSPLEVELGTVSCGEQRDFSVTVTSAAQPDFEIIGNDPFPKDLTAAAEKAIKDGAAVWTVRGRYAPTSASATGGGNLKFDTNIKGAESFTIRVRAIVKMPIECKPSLLQLNKVRAGQGRTEKIVVEANDGTDLAATAVRIEGLTIAERFVKVSSKKDGKNVVVELEIAPDAPTGLVRGDIIVELNHPTVKQQRVLFNGFVR